MSNSPPAEAGEVVLAVLAEAKKVVIDSKALVQLVQNTENQVDDMEDKLLTLARSLATTTHQLIKLINGQIKSPEQPTLAEEYVLSAAKDVRSGVLEFVQAVRSAASNPYDFLSQQTVDNRFKYLVTVVKNVVSAMESVEIESSSNQSSSADRVSNQHNLARQHVEEIRAHITELQHALFDVKSRERMQTVNAAAKKAVQGLYKLMESAEESATLTEHSVELKRCAVQLVNAVKGMMKDALSPTHQEQFKRAARAIDASTQKFFLAVAPGASHEHTTQVLDAEIQKPVRAPPTPSPTPDAVNRLPPNSNEYPPTPPPPVSSISATTPPPASPGTLNKGPSNRLASTFFSPPMERQPIMRAKSDMPNDTSSRHSMVTWGNKDRTLVSSGERPRSKDDALVRRVTPGFDGMPVTRDRSASTVVAPPQNLVASIPPRSNQSRPIGGTTPQRQAQTLAAPRSAGNPIRRTSVGKGASRLSAAAASDVIRHLRAKVPDFNKAWNGMVMDQRKAILTQCAEAVEHRMKKDPMQREPSPAIPTPNRTESNNVLDDAKLLELSELMGLGGNADFDRIKTAAASLQREPSSRSAAEFQRSLTMMERQPTRLKSLIPALQKTIVDLLFEIGQCFTLQKRSGGLVEKAEVARLALVKCAEWVNNFEARSKVVKIEKSEHDVLKGTVTQIRTDLQPQPQLAESFVNAATADPKSADIVCNSLTERAQRSQTQAEALTAQLLAELRLLFDAAMCQSGDVTTYTQTQQFAMSDIPLAALTLQTAASVAGVASSLGHMLQWLETFLFVINEVQDTSAKKHATLRPEAETIGEPLWGVGKDDDEGLSSNNDMLAPASLNAAVRRLTSPENYDNKFMKTFITTYQSFTEPWVLLNKLIERYTVPASHQDKKPTIQMRVCIVIKYWIENQFYDLDERTLARLQTFIGVTLVRDGSKEMANRLSAELDRCYQERKNDAVRGFGERTHLNIPQFDRSPAKLFVSYSSKDIAEQMTEIESVVFKKIKPSELLNLAWNKKPLQFRAPNVLEMISRSNKVSRFVASTIVWLSARAARAAMYAKWVQVADRLRKINNFNTLMGVLAGLNMSSVNRLKHTQALLSQKHRDVKEELQQVISRNQSFKNYRSVLHTATGPTVPFLGVYLTDLTFTEDGNPDYVANKAQPSEKLINFKKHKLVHNTISEIQLYQQQRYDVLKVEPLYTMMVELPNIDESALYALSLVREPRGCDPNTLP